MSTIQKLCSYSKDIRSICSRLTSLNLQIGENTILKSINQTPIKLFAAKIHSTVPQYDLMEFFDDKKHWGQNEVRSGRSWITDELRIKSNSDLHKLWFVLLKERNMLLTMEHECDEKYEYFPNPERLDKVEESMQNLETVVRERNRAYYELETGGHGERPARYETNQIGMKFLYRETEHLIPKRFNKKWQETHIFQCRGNAVRNFLRLYHEKLYNVKRKARNRDRNHVVHLMRRYPNVSQDLLRTKYPSVDIDKILKTNKARGHFAPE